MKTTKANVEQYARDMGYVPVQIDSIPEGFCFKRSDIIVGNVLHEGEYVAFIPLSDWENESVVHASTIEKLIELYQKATLKLNGK